MPLSDREVRQQLGYGIARAENIIDEATAAVGHLRGLHEAMTERIEAPEPTPDPTPEPGPTPAPEPTPGPAWTHRFSIARDTADLIARANALAPGGDAFPLWVGGRVVSDQDAADRYITLHNGMLRTIWPGGAESQIGVNLFLPREVWAREVWIEIPFMFSDGFRVASDFKTWFFLGGTDYADTTVKWEARYGAFRNRATVKWHNDHLAAAVGPDGQPLDIYDPVLVGDGRLHMQRVHIRNGAGGFIRTWLDGRVLIPHTYFDAPDLPIHTIALGRNADPIADSSVWWGDTQVHLTDPGW